MLETIARIGRTVCRSHSLLVLVAIALVSLGSAALVDAKRASAEEAVSTEAARIARGGRLYDKWFAVLGAEKPKETLSAWPASNDKKKGNVTWRCKSCHGWDNLGADGAYASGSYKTGIKGVRGFAGADPSKIVAVMKDQTHGLSGLMAERDFADLALFVSKGQVDMDRYIDRATKAPKGDKAKGQAYFETVCASCHGAQGTKIKDMKPLGKLMGNPWEILHKIVFGQPNEAMPALYMFDRQIAADIMAYAATLPKEK
ncbi:MAG: c-type cytochrome [Alphaproteobacteria bacterium]